MAKIARVQEVDVDLLRPYGNNAKVHGEDQVEKLCRSIREFGFISPCLIDSAHNVIAGHGRIMAAKKLGMKKVPCLFVEGLSEEQRRAYTLADNRLTELGEWNMQMVQVEIGELEMADFDVSLTGFDEIQTGDADWFSREEKDYDARQEGNDEYNAFLDKFEEPKTTDDCYTPDNIYDAVAAWVAERYAVDAGSFLRPFYPGGDYKNHNYPEKCVVVDNPPFSILAEIIDFYLEKRIPFFLFAPALAAFNYLSRRGVTAVAQNSSVTYENGAEVLTSFLTNMEGDGVAAFTDHMLWETVNAANTENEKAMHANLPKYEYPDEVLTSAKMGWMIKHGQELVIMRRDCLLISELDAQKEAGKAIFGKGLLLSERAAAERAAAERAAAERAAAERAAAERAAATRWKLSEREIEIVKKLGGGVADG